MMKYSIPVQLFNDPPPKPKRPLRYILNGKSNNNTVQTVTGYL